MIAISSLCGYSIIFTERKVWIFERVKTHMPKLHKLIIYLLMMLYSLDNTPR